MYHKVDSGLWLNFCRCPHHIIHTAWLKQSFSCHRYFLHV